MTSDIRCGIAKKDETRQHQPVGLPTSACHSSIGCTIERHTKQNETKISKIINFVAPTKPVFYKNKYIDKIKFLNISKTSKYLSDMTIDKTNMVKKQNKTTLLDYIMVERFLIAITYTTSGIVTSL